MKGFVITVDCKPKVGAMAASRKLIDKNAKCHASANRAAGASPCTYPRGANDRIFLYKIYDSRAAFGTHLPSPPLATINKTSADLVMNENIVKLHLIFEGSGNRR